MSDDNKSAKLKVHSQNSVYNLSFLLSFILFSNVFSEQFVTSASTIVGPPEAQHS